MTESNLLHSVARLFNIQINLYDGFGHLMQPPPEAILTRAQYSGRAGGTHG